ncbi:MAG: STAS domain-containing protein [bacterium]|nr:STAS domain-containing protein [bacterium]
MRTIKKGSSCSLSVDWDKPEGQPTTLKVLGEIDLSNAEVLEEAINEGILSGEKEIRINFDDVRYLDSEGIKALLRAQRRIKDPEVKLVLFSPSASRVSRLFRQVGLTEVFDINFT